jgi:hypothetical protein
MELGGSSMKTVLAGLACSALLDKTVNAGHEHQAQQNAAQQKKCNKAADDKQFSCARSRRQA